MHYVFLENTPSTGQAESKIRVQLRCPPVCVCSLVIILKHSLQRLFAAVASYCQWLSESCLTFRSFASSSSGLKRHLRRMITWGGLYACSPSILKCTETRTVKVGVGGSGFFHLANMCRKQGILSICMRIFTCICIFIQDNIIAGSFARAI